MALPFGNNSGSSMFGGGGFSLDPLAKLGGSGYSNFGNYGNVLSPQTAVGGSNWMAPAGLNASNTNMGIPGWMPDGATAGGAGGTDWLTMLMGKEGQAGLAGPLASLGSSLMSGFMGMQNYGLAKDQLAFQKEAYATNLENQKKTVNTQLEDRQRARIVSNANGYQSLDDYMNKNGV